MIGALKDFVFHVLDHWIFLLGLLFLIEPAVDNSVPAYKQWAQAHLSRALRAWITIPAAILCVFVACFLAFSDEYKAHEKDEALINGTRSKPGYASQVQTLSDTVRRQDQDIDGAGGYKAQIAAMGGNLGKAQDQATYWQQHKPQVVVQTKEVPVVIPSGAVQMTDAQIEKVKKIKVALGAFLAEGNDLANQTADPKLPDTNQAANEWATKVEAFLSANLDDSYVNRFRDSSNIPSAVITGLGYNSPRANLWWGVHTRTIRLHEFIAELSK